MATQGCSSPQVGAVKPLLQLKVVVVKLDRLVNKLEPMPVPVFPARLAEPDAHDRVLRVAPDDPTLLALVDAVARETASHPLQLDGLVLLGDHCPHLDGLAADDPDHLEWIDIGVSVTGCKRFHFAFLSGICQSRSGCVFRNPRVGRGRGIRCIL